MIGSTISHYRILEQLGSGGMGVVYKAEDTRLKRTVALKFLPMMLGTNPESRERFTHEAQAASALDDINICTIHEIGSSDDGELFICMAYYEGESLRQKIERGPLPTSEAIDITLQIARGLAKAHHHGILHRDIKPANVMITKEGVAKIVDFGLAKLSGATKVTRTGSTLGTTMYMSPEQARGEDTDRRTDIWSLGIVLYEMLAGNVPFRGEHEAAILYSVLNEEPEGFHNGIPGVGPELEVILTRALQKERKARYQSADELIADLERLTFPHPAPRKLTPRTVFRALRKLRVMVPVVLILAGIIAGSLWMVQRQAKIRWARETLLPEIDRLITAGDMGKGIFFPRAYALTTEAQRIIPDDPHLQALLLRCASRMTVISDPPGAQVFLKAFGASDSAWEYLGLTPCDSLRVPMGVLACKLTEDGYDTLLTVTSTFSLYGSEMPAPRMQRIERTLDKRGTVPDGMVHIKGWQAREYGFINDFHVDRYEVTNKSYKEFVDGGGYLSQEYWKQPFIRNGKTLSFQEAIIEFVDQTGRAGPSTWTAGSYPEGQDRYPVSGVSWYEAAAYAEYVHKSLPTWMHWYMASGFSPPWGKGVSPVILGECNFWGKGPVAVGDTKGLMPTGVFDIVGNVREWCWNEMPEGRLIRGGAWNDAVYQSANWSQAAAFDRSPKNGFRCVLYPDPAKISPELFKRDSLDQWPDFYKTKPVPTAVFAVYLEQYAYDKTNLNARTEWKKADSKDWSEEKVSFDAAYGGERVTAHLFLPKNAKPPFQTVIYFPGSASVEQASSENMDQYIEFRSNLYFFLQAGRAVLYPVYKGTFERSDSVLTSTFTVGNDSRRFSEYFIQVVKDFRRSVDYLATRTDIDTGKIAYCGFSWGGLWSAVIPAIEPRLKCSIVILGGLWGFGRPEVNPINYVSRVRVPTLILSGKYDAVFRMEENVKPLYDLLGTGKQNKVLKVFDSDHFIPTNDLIRESLAWLDKYLGAPIR